MTYTHGSGKANLSNDEVRVKLRFDKSKVIEKAVIIYLKSKSRKYNIQEQGPWYTKDIQESEKKTRRR